MKREERERKERETERDRETEKETDREEERHLKNWRNWRNYRKEKRRERAHCASSPLFFYPLGYIFRSVKPVQLHFESIPLPPF